VPRTTRERRPLRYRGVRFGSNREQHPRASYLIAVVQTAIAAYSAFVVVSAGVLVGEGTRHSGRVKVRRGRRPLHLWREIRKTLPIVTPRPPANSALPIRLQG
jgi:hypothetical protein